MRRYLSVLLVAVAALWLTAGVASATSPQGTTLVHGVRKPPANAKPGKATVRFIRPRVVAHVNPKLQVKHNSTVTVGDNGIMVVAFSDGVEIHVTMQDQLQNIYSSMSPAGIAWADSIDQFYANPYVTCYTPQGAVMRCFGIQINRVFMSNPTSDNHPTYVQCGYYDPYHNQHACNANGGYSGAQGPVAVDNEELQSYPWETNDSACWNPTHAVLTGITVATQGHYWSAGDNTNLTSQWVNVCDTTGPDGQ